MRGFLNQASTTILDSGGIDSAAVIIHLADPTDFAGLTDPVSVICGAEIMLATAIAGNALTVVRGQEGTTAVAHAEGAVLTAGVTAGALAALREDAVAEVEADTAFVKWPVGIVPGEMFYSAGGGLALRIPAGTAGQVLTLVSGVPTWANLPADVDTGGGGGGGSDMAIGAAKLNADSSTGFTPGTSGGGSPFVGAHIEYDHGGYCDLTGHPDTFVVPTGKAGIYHVLLSLFDNTLTVKWATVWLTKNGTTVIQGSSAADAGNNVGGVQVEAWLILAEGDTIGANVLVQPSGFNYIDDGTGMRCFMQIVGFAAGW